MKCNLNLRRYVNEKGILQQIEKLSELVLHSLCRDTENVSRQKILATSTDAGDNIYRYVKLN